MLTLKKMYRAGPTWEENRAVEVLPSSDFPGREVARPENIGLFQYKVCASFDVHLDGVFNTGCPGAMFQRYVLIRGSYLLSV